MPIDKTKIKNSFSIKKDERGFFVLTFLLPSLNEYEETSMQAQMIYDQAKQNYETDKDADRAIIDLRQLGSLPINSRTSPLARNTYTKLIAEAWLKKVAFVGKGIFLKVLVNMLAASAGAAPKVKWFEDIGKAEKWILKS